MAGFSRNNGRNNGHLTVDGLRVDDIAQKFGTPLYIYSASAIKNAYKNFSNAVSDVKGNIHFALKANSNMAVLRLLAKLGAGADIVSGGEMARALAAGIPPQKIIFSGVGKSDSEIRDALNNNISQLNAESVQEVERILEIAQALNKTAPIALRINPDVETSTHAKIATGKSDTKFGIPSNEVIPLYQKIAQHPHAKPAGLAVHIGSQIMTLDAFENAWTHLLALAQNLRAQNMDVPALDLGGGLGIDYEKNKNADLKGFGNLAKKIFQDQNLSLGFEPGRFIIADAGILLTRIIYTKSNQNKNFVITDAAMNDLIRPTLYDAFHRIETVAPPSQKTYTADIVGPVCETGDYFALQRQIPIVKPNDLLAIMSAGAYCAVMRSSYNSRIPAPEILVINGEAHLVSKKQTHQDLIEMDSIPKALN